MTVRRRSSISAGARSSCGPGDLLIRAATKSYGCRTKRSSSSGDLAEERIFPIFPWFPPDDADLDAARWAAILGEIEGWKPKIVVPGHGDVGGAEILRAVRDYMIDLGRRVAAERKAGKTADEIVAELAPKIRAEHPDWDSPEWIDFAIRYFSVGELSGSPGNGQAPISLPPAMPFGRNRMIRSMISARIASPSAGRRGKGLATD